MMTETIAARALLAADTDRTQDYVFESARLPEIRGASTLLTTLNEERSPALIQQLDPSAQCIYVGGGGLLYEVAADKAPVIQLELERLYPRETGVATITCVYLVLPANQSPDQGLPYVTAQVAPDTFSEFQRQRWQHADRSLDNFGAWVRLLGHNLRQRKQEKAQIPFVEAPSHAERCHSCRTRPADGVYQDFEAKRAFCPECRRKRELGGRFYWRDEFLKRLREHHPDLYQPYLNGATPAQVRPPQDLETLANLNAAAGNKQNYVAFIYADGDGVGAYIEQQQSRKDYEMVSEILDGATWNAATYALAKNLRVNAQTQPFEIITVGGDDVMLIAPAAHGLRIAHDMAAQFRRYLDTRAVDASLTLSTAVVIAPVHMPVRLMRDFARELLKSGAKPRAKAEKGATIDFQVFISDAVYGTDIMDLRGAAPYTLAVDDKDKPLRLFNRPYNLPETERLLFALGRLRATQFPKSQLYALAQALERGRRRATLFYLYQRSRLNSQHREALAAVEAIVPTNERYDPLPWRKAASQETYQFSTTLRDVAELYDFVCETAEKEV